MDNMMNSAQVTATLSRHKRGMVKEVLGAVVLSFGLIAGASVVKSSMTVGSDGTSSIKAAAEAAHREALMSLLRGEDPIRSVEIPTYLIREHAPVRAAAPVAGGHAASETPAAARCIGVLGATSRSTESTMAACDHAPSAARAF